MQQDSVAEFVSNGLAGLRAGSVALIFVEDAVEVGSTIRHHRRLGFPNIVVFTPDAALVPSDLHDDVLLVRLATFEENALEQTVNTLVETLQGRWLYYCYNAEYLFFPFCETRFIEEMLAFHSEERRDAMLTYVIDLYAPDLAAYPDGVSLDAAHLDRSGYFAQARLDAEGNPLERQFDFMGGLRWRFEEHVPAHRRKIDRISLFRAQRGLELRADHCFNIAEYNTYSCPWHNNLTAAICSFRTAKALRSNPGSAWAISSFRWHATHPFDWTSRQLMELGLMEPGQWF